MQYTNNLGFGNSKNNNNVLLQKKTRELQLKNNIPLNDPILTNPNIPFVKNTTLLPQPPNRVPLRPLPPSIGFMGKWGL